MSGNTKSLALFAAVALVIFAVVAIQVSVWNECRGEGHSFFYCLRLISR